MSKSISEAKYGHSQDTWEGAKREAIRAILAQAPSPIFYSDLTARIGSIAFDPEGYDFHYLLYEISKEEDAAGRGLLSALVVLKEDGRPGDGFWSLAKEQGRDITDREHCWIAEIAKVQAHCHDHPSAA